MILLACILDSLNRAAAGLMLTLDGFSTLFLGQLVRWLIRGNDRTIVFESSLHASIDKGTG